MNNGVLVEYVKDRYGHRVGVVVGLVAENEFGRLESRVGWSRCNKKDKYDNNNALAIAEGRALSNRVGINAPRIPRDVQKVYDRMMVRVARYFKDVPVGAVVW